MVLLNLARVIFMAGGAALVYILLRHRFGLPKGGPEDRTQSTGQRQGVHLCQVYPPPGTTIEPDVDIIAIHGLDTRSPDTWTWADTSDQKQPCVNWLQDQNMLPSKVNRARIFTCDWPSDIFQTSNLVQKTIEELARLLLVGIKSRLLVANDHTRREDRPILFIASCLGGIILMKALMMANHEYSPLRATTRGIVFLSTPFRGTSFQDVAKWAEPGLTVCAWLRGKKVTKLLNRVKGSTFDLEELVRSFTQLCQNPDHRYQVFNFYEKGYTNIYSKVFPWLPDRYIPAKQLVDESSATLDIVPHPLPLNRRHVMMNKFHGPRDPDFQAVAQKIEEIVHIIRKGTALDRADAWMREKHYTADRLKIERLSGMPLSMEKCYINLAIVEEPGERESWSGEGDAQRCSPFSLAARLKVETPEKGIRVDMQAVFEKRERPRHRTLEPRRILIRGRAGVGKTTLCKKIVHDFIYHGTWKDLFDRILWVPLRRLKKEPKEGYNFEDLFFQEYLSQNPKGKDLAHELWDALHAAEYHRTLFVLDGLDEVSEELDESRKVFPLLRSLLTLTNVITTSRPHGPLPYWLKGTFDLELEAIGFYPEQVKNYIQGAFPRPEPREADSKKANDVQSFLQKHQLIQGLVRIPIILDALCYTWDDFDGKTIPQTMTAVYQAIEQRLWKKDAVKLEKYTRAQIQIARPRSIRRSVQSEIYLLEVLAFTGIYNDMTDFEPKHRDDIFEQFKTPETNPLLDQTLDRLSFLRTSDASTEDPNRNYHFLHLTLQEYFAARYFVRQWTVRQPLMCLMLSSKENEQIDPVEFLRRHKYHARYDILWRFIAGMLDVAGEATRFFQVIGGKPLDLLGSTHQRLVIHCLSEVRHPFSLRKELEAFLSRWLVFQCKKLREWGQPLPWRDTLASEMELPEKSIAEVLQNGDEEVRIIVLRSMESRQKVPLRVTEIVTSWLRGDRSDSLTISVLHLFRSTMDRLPLDTLNAVAARLEDQDLDTRIASIYALAGQSYLQETTLSQIAAGLEHQYLEVRMASIYTLNSQLNLPEATLNQIVERLEHQDWDVRRAAVKALGRQSDLPEGILNQIAARLEHQDWDVRRAAVKALGRQSDLPEGILTQIAARLEDQDWGVRIAAIDALVKQANLAEWMLNRIVGRLKDQDPDVRGTAIDALRSQSNLPEGTLNQLAARLEDQDPVVKVAAINALGRQSNLSEVTLTQIAARLEDQDWGVRIAAIGALVRQSDFLQLILNRIAARLKDQDPDVRRTAIHALGRQSNLLEETLNQMVARLEDQDPDVRRATVKALGRHLNLSEVTLNDIAARLESQDPDVRRAAIDTLGRQSNLSEVTLNQIAVRLKDQDKEVRTAAINALGRQSKLSEVNLDQIAAQLKDQDPDVRRAAIDTLRRQSTLSEVTLNQIAARLKDQDPDVRKAAINALGRQSNLSEVTLNQIGARLEDRSLGVRRAAIDALRSESNLPEATLNQIAARLEDHDFDIRRAAINALRSQSRLPEATLDQIAARLEDQHREVGIASIDTLRSNFNLPEVILNQISARLKDRQSINLLAIEQVTSMLMERQDFHSICLVGGHAQGLFSILLKQSFKNHLAWYIQDGKSCLETDNCLGSVGLLHGQHNLEVAINRAREDAAIPAVAVSHGAEGPV